MDKNATSNNLLDELLSEVTPQMQKRVTDKMLLAIKIYDGMIALGYTQKEFAKKMGVGQSVVSRWLSGEQNFTTDTLSDIETILNISLLDNKPKLQEDKKMAFSALAAVRQFVELGDLTAVVTSSASRTVNIKC